MTRPLAVAAPRPTPSSKALRSASTRDPRRLRFGEFELIAESCELLRRDRLGAPRRVKLQPQPARALLFLAERSGRLVTRTELQRHLWGENHFVDYEQGLNYCIRSIRRALGDDASAPSFLETVPRRGYRFTRGVDVSERPVGLSAATERAARRRALSSRPGGVNERRLALVLAAVVVLSLALHWALSAGLLQSPGPPEPPKLAVLPFEDLTGGHYGSPLAGSLADELISHLAGSYPDRLGVIARTSSAAYAGRGLTAAQLGSELDADYLVTGGLQLSGDRTRVSVQLIRVRDETNIWAEIYDRPADQADWESWVRAVGIEVAGRLVPPAVT